MPVKIFIKNLISLKKHLYETSKDIKTCESKFEAEEPNSYDLTPQALAFEYICKDFIDEYNVLEASVMSVATELSYEPIICDIIREWYLDKC